MERQFSIFPLREFFKVLLLSTVLISSVLAQSPQNPEINQSVSRFVNDWFAAWQSQETNAYFDFYHDSFTPENNISIDNWRQKRIQNISRPERISITVEALDLLFVTSETATVRISFLYRATNYADRTSKELTLSLSENEIEGIVRENNLTVERLPEQILAPEVVTDAVPANTLNAEINDSEIVEDNAENDIEESTNNESDFISQPQAEINFENRVEPIADTFTAESAEIPAPATAPVSRSTTSNANWVPPGFENLNQPQVTEIDVYYGGYFLTSVLAEFTDSEVTLLDPASLSSQLNNIKNPELFQAMLVDPLDANNELLCFSDFQTDCGSLETDSVEIIFDRSLLRMWLFIAPDLLLDAGSNVVRFLPASEAGLSFMNQSAVYFATEEFSLTTYNLFNNTLFSWGENRLSMRSNVVSDEGFDIDTMAFFREFEGRDYRVGLVRESANGFSFMPNERFAGVSYASSLLTRADLEQSLGTEIELYFSTRSRVEIYREGRLISTDYYNVGNNLLNTSDLPNGSYMIELRIIDAAGSISVEERYYSKTANIPPADQALYFVHIGRVENDLDINRLSRTGQDELLFRAGYNMRLGQTLGGSLGFSSLEDNQFMELGLFKQGQNYEVQANAAYENTGATGLDLRFRYRHPKFNLTFNARQVSNGLLDSQIGQDYQQFNGMLEIPTRRGFFSLFHRHVERPQNGRNLNTGIRYRTRNTDLPGGTLSSNLELSKNGDEVLALWNFNWLMQGDRRTSVYSPTLAYANEDASRDSGLYGSYETNWFRGQDGGNEYIYALRGDYDTRSSIEARMEANTDLGTADITGRYNEVNDQVEFSGRISSSFATTGKASAIGGRRRSESAFLVKVEGDVDADASFDVLVNGSVRGKLNAGETLLIPVSPYYTYNIELKAVGETLVNLDNRIYRETMYPGNVVNLSWSSQVINIALGRLLDEQGVPVSNALIQNVVGVAMTDDNGMFQAEINHDTDSLVVMKGLERCTAVFENPQINATVLPLGTLVCR